MSIQLVVDNLCIAYGTKSVVKHVSFNLEKGEIGCLLGSSGCGKTTILRAVAGFEPPTSGFIKLDGRCVNDKGKHIPPEKRNVGMVFQEHALFPNLSVAKNIGFGLNRHSKSQTKERVAELLGMIGLEGRGDCYPHQLSGGQQQRVALARALAPRPEILLLDEPFSNLDVELRTSLAHELRAIIKKEAITALLVTHDQNEAFAMADHIGIIEQGTLSQWDNAFALYHAPANLYVANFIGEGVILDATVDQNGQLQTELGHGVIANNSYSSNDQLKVLVRPDDILFDPESPIKTEIINRAFRGAEYLYTLLLPSGQPLMSLLPSHNRLEIGAQMPISLSSDPLPVFSRGS